MFQNPVSRNVALLALCQALFLTTTSAVVTSGALVGYHLADIKTLATLPLALQFGAVMVVTFPVSMFMKRRGRRAGFVLGALIGAVGAGTATLAIFEQSFWLFCVGSFLIGCFNGTAQYFRFAAADASDIAFRSRAISLVLAGGVVAAFTGPNLARFTKDLFEPVAFAGVYSTLILVYLSIVAVVTFIRIPPPSVQERRQGGRPMIVIGRQPKFLVAVLGAAIAYFVMSFLMTITPVAMSEHHFDFADSSIVIQGHVLGMFLPAFFTGHLIARFGAPNVMIAGGVLLAASLGVNLAGLAFGHFFVALLLLGLGWNFLFTGATTLLTECYEPAEKAKVQAMNDLVVFGCVSISTLLSGAANTAFGWTALQIWVAPLVVGALIATLWLRISERRREALV